MSEVVRKELPEGWQWTTMEDIADVIGGGTPKSKEKRFFDGGEIPWLTPADLSGYTAKHISKGARNITEAGLNGSSAKLMPAGTVLFTSRAPIGYVAIASNEISTNQGFKSFVLKSEDILPDYVYWWLKGNKQLAESFASGTTFLELSGSKAKKLPIPIAPPEQQKRIVAKIEELFSHIDAGIEALKKAKQLLKQYRQSVLKAAVTGELTKEWREANKAKLETVTQLLGRVKAEREQEFERKLAEWEEDIAQWMRIGEKSKKPAKPKKPKELEPISEDKMNSLGDLPKGWVWSKLGNLTVDVFDGPFGSNLKSSDYVEEGVRVIRLENIGNLEFKDEKKSFVTPEKYELLKKHTVGSGDLIFSSFVADGTRVVVLPKHIDKSVNKADCFCVRCYGSSIYNTYLALFLATNGAYKRLENEVHGATRPRINTTQLKNIEVPICSTEEQNEAVRILELKFDAITRLEGEINEKLLLVDKNKQSVLASAFTGELN